ncbi:MAG: PAS domain-containing sensor histidine kinase, partial [Armatimonadota bacterium]|nr:PAS domain-containing sensor histidine kinase [Armatimonadota bacterium]
MKGMSGSNGVVFIDSSVHSPFLAEDSAVAIAVSDGETHILHYVNPAFCQLFGSAAPEFVGRPFPEVVPEGVTVIIEMLLDRVFSSGEAESLADDSFVAHPGSPSQTQAPYWSYTVWPLLDPWGRPIGLVTQISHATQRLPATPESYSVMLTANQQLVLAAIHESERAEMLLLADRTKDEFLAMLAHELRNPLAAIRTGVYLVSQRAGNVAPALAPDCALIERQIGHLARLLDDLLDVSRISSGKIDLRKERMDLMRVVQHAVLTTSPLMVSRGHELTATVPPKPVCVDGDPARLEQVLTNLLQNAGKYTDPGGHIWLTIETVDAPWTNPSQPAKAGEVVIRVRDTGIGIAPETLPHIFDLFVQTDRSLDRSQGGLGIGLTLVRRLVEMHGGSVVAHSDGRGQGSEFVVRLPLLETAEDFLPAPVAPVYPEVH